MFDDGEKYSISARIYRNDLHDENDRIKDIARSRFGQEIIYKLLEYKTPVVVSIKETTDFDREQIMFREYDTMDEIFTITASCTPVQYKNVVVELVDFISVKASFWRRLKWMFTGE